MSDYFFYDLNKKMADLASKQQLTEDAAAAPAKPVKSQLNERDLGKHNNATTGFAALAKKTGGGEKGARIAGAQLAKMRAKGQVKESMCSKCDCDPCKCHSMDESALQAAFGKKKYGEKGMQALQQAGREHAGKEKMVKIRQQYDQYDESVTDEGNAFSKAVVDAKRDGIQPGEKIRVGGKQYSLREQGVAEGMAPMSPDGATAPPAKGADGQYPVVTSGPNKGKRWSPNTPGPTNPAMKEAAKYRASKYKDKLYTQKPGDSDSYDSVSYGYDIPERPKNDPGQKRKMGGVGDEYSRTDPLEKGFGRGSASTSINTQGKRKGLPSRDQVTGLKQSIRDVLGKHTEPNLPEGGVPMTPKQKRFAKLAPPVDKITFADKIVGAKKEVDEMLGDVAANAMKKAVRGRNRDMEESSLYDTPTRRKSSSGGEIDTAEPGVTRHRAVKGNYSGAGHDVGSDDDTPRSGQAGRRKVGAGMGTKIGAKINTGKSKLMTREGNMDPGEYDQEGEMAKDTIKTVVRHAQALEKILGDNDNLPEWVQSKMAKIEGMMTAVDDYMQNQQDDQMKMDEESTNKRDNRAERAGRRVAKDIEYDEKKKDGIRGQRRGSEDIKAERAGKKVAKDIEYDEKVKEGSGPKEKAHSKYVDRNSPESKAKLQAARDNMAKNTAAEPGKKLANKIDNKKKKEVDETTTSGSVATGGSAPKSGGSVSYGKGIYDSFNREVEKMISESMSINMSMNNDSHGGPSQTLTVTATDEDAMQLAMLLKSAGIGSQDHGDDMHSMTDNDSEMDAIYSMDHDHGDETCPSCGSSPCGCDNGMMEEAYGDTDATENQPDYPTDEVGTDNEGMYSGGFNGPKSTGQTTVPVNAGQKDRMGYEGDNELRRMMEIAGFVR